jgi:hypothetical protein
LLSISIAIGRSTSPPTTSEGTRSLALSRVGVSGGFSSAHTFACASLFYKRLQNLKNRCFSCRGCNAAISFVSSELSLQLSQRLRFISRIGAYLLSDPVYSTVLPAGLGQVRGFGRFHARFRIFSFDEKFTESELSRALQS